jgi:hypothetical protein
MSYRLGESDEAIIMAQVVIMFMEGNQILESFCEKEGCLFGALFT